MFIAFIKSGVLFALAGDGGTPWWSYPGFEAWKFLNLFIFVGLLTYILRKPISEAMRARRESIRRELMRAREERDAAVLKLEEVEARLARLDGEVTDIRKQAVEDARSERERLTQATEDEAAKLRDQAVREIESAGKAARQELRIFAAEQSVRLAEEMIRRDIRPEDDARLVTQSIQELGGARR